MIWSTSPAEQSSRIPCGIGRFAPNYEGLILACERDLRCPKAVFSEVRRGCSNSKLAAAKISGGT